MERRLAAIMAADVVGYSKLMGADESGTFERLKALRKELIQPQISARKGRVVKVMGDGLLAVFSSAVEAVQCASDIQRKMIERDTGLPDEQRIRLRIGINLGDVIVEGSDIYGDGVNVAARLETLCEPDGICISGIAFNAVEGKLGLTFQDGGEHVMKNIARPVQVYRVNLDKDPAPFIVTRSGSGPVVQDRPSIAVLPFDNISGDPEQEYFADGIVEDIITALSRLDEIFVIARNSTFAYKGRATDIRQIGRELGVRYVLEGSVRKAGNRIRITCQLIEGEGGAHLWADRFDGDLEDVFDLQDQITDNVVSAIEPTLRAAEIERSRSLRPNSIDAYDLYLRSLPHLYAMRPDENVEALRLLKQAIKHDPDYVPALAGAAWCFEQRVTRGWATVEETDVTEAIALARKVIATKSNNANALATAGFVLLMVGRHYEVGLNTIRHALSMSANSLPNLLFGGWANNFAGRPDDAIPCFEHARRISPVDPVAFFFKTGTAMACLLKGQPEKAFDLANQSMALNSTWDNTLLVLAAAAHQLERIEDARTAVRNLLAAYPNATISLYSRVMPFRHKEHAELITEGLRAGGMPE